MSETLCVLHFLTDKKEELVVSQKFCISGMQLKYKEIYIPINVNFSIDQNLIETLPDVCQKIIVYISENVPSIPVLNILSVLKDFPIILFVSNPIGFLNIPLIEFYKFTNLKFYNLSTTTEIEKSGLFYTPSGQRNLNLIKSFFKNNILECQPWFEYVLFKMKDCGSNRLFQNSATCVLNSIMNGMLMSEDLRYFIIERYNFIMRVLGNMGLQDKLEYIQSGTALCLTVKEDA